MADNVIFRKEGDSIEHVAGADIDAGDVLVIEDRIFVAKHDILSGETGTLAAKGAFDFPRTAATAYTAGKKVYWDDTLNVATETPSTHKQIGYVTKAVGSGEAATVPVRCYLQNTAV